MRKEGGLQLMQPALSLYRMKCNCLRDQSKIMNPQLDALASVYDALLELAAGGVDVGAAGVADRCLDAS